MESVIKPINTYQPIPTYVCVKHDSLKSRTSFWEMGQLQWSGWFYKDCFSPRVEERWGSRSAVGSCMSSFQERFSTIGRNGRLTKPVFVLTLPSNQMEPYKNFCRKMRNRRLKISSSPLSELLFLCLKDHLELENDLSIPWGVVMVLCLTSLSHRNINIQQFNWIEAKVLGLIKWNVAMSSILGFFAVVWKEPTCLWFCSWS